MVAGQARPRRLAMPPPPHGQAALPGHRGLVFLVAPPAGGARGARRRVRSRRRRAGAGSWRRDPRRGFRLRPLAWRRRGDGIFGAGRALAAIAALYRRERPDIVHLVALKPVCSAAIAARLAFARGTGRPAPITAVNGLGSGLTPATIVARLGRSALGWAVRRAAARAASSCRTRKTPPRSPGSASRRRGSC